MSFNPQRLKKAFYAISGVFKRQSGFGTAIPNADLDTRLNCSVDFEDVIQSEVVYDCSGEDVFEETVESQLKRVTLTFASITPQLLFGFIALKLGACAAPTGTAQNEKQTITIDATAGTFTITFAFEGKTGTTPALAYNASAAAVLAALEALDSIGEGNVTVGLAGSVYTVEFVGDLALANMPAMTTNAASLTGGTHTATVATTQAGGNKYHAATRSTDDSLPKTSIGCGYDSATAATPHKFRDLVVESIVVNLNRRKNVTATIKLLGRFTPEDLAAFTVPDCDNLAALKGRDCEILINSSYLSEEFWQATITLDNNVPTGEDLFPFDSVEIGNPERGDKPTYPLTMQVLGSEGDTVGEICRLRSKVPVEFRLGKPGDRCNLIFPNTLLKFAGNPRVFVGERNRSAHAIDAVPHKDATLLAPMRAEAYLDQTATFLASA
jgi:hypothetical protein